MSLRSMVIVVASDDENEVHHFVVDCADSVCQKRRPCDDVPIAVGADVGIDA